MSNICDLKEEDLKGCAKLFLKTFGEEPWLEPWTFERAKKRLEDVFFTPGFKGAVVKEGEEIKGAILGSLEQWYDGENFCIKEFFVDSKTQGKGYGRQLLEFLEEELIRDHKVGIIHLWTMGKSRAEIFYGKSGYEIPEELIMMRKKIRE